MERLRAADVGSTGRATSRQSTGWRFAAGATSSPIARAGRVVVGIGQGVFAIDAATGQPLWRFDGVPVTPGGRSFTALGQPAVTDDSVYFCDQISNFYAFDVAGGSGPAPG